MKFMKQLTLSVAMSVAVLMLSSGLASAIEKKGEVQPEAAKASPKSAKADVGVKNKSTAPIKLVDINSAKKEELMKLPTISAAEADKIIAGRPFGSKTWLVSNKIVSEINYQVLKNKIICKISKKDFATLMAQAKKDKKK